MGAGAARSVPVHLSPPMTSLSGDIWGPGRVVALLSPGQATINLTIWFPNSVVPSSASVVTADLALTLSWASSFLLPALQAAIISWE